MKRVLQRSGASLVELLVVFFIIAIMLGMLLPALQSARSRALTAQCQNNVRQLGVAVRRFIDSKKRFPTFEHWSIDVLKYIEEEELANALAHEIPHNGKVARPKLFQCPQQSEVETTIAGIPTCHYVLVVDRPVNAANADRVRWDLHDREELSFSDAPVFRPWYVGPELSFKLQTELFAAKQGPHGGLFYTMGGQTRGGN